jgi:hypothetical protein
VTSTQPKLGIVAGAGEMPRQIAQACERARRPYFVLAIDEFAPPMDAAVPHKRVPISKIGASIAALRGAGCVEVAFAGKLQRPDGRGVKLRPDLGGLEFLARLFGSLSRSDDRLHRAIHAMFKSRGLTVVSPLHAAPDLAARSGCLTHTRPSDALTATFPTALALAKQHGMTKQGQAVVIDAGAVIAREGRAGTDAMLASLNGAGGSSGILVKAMAPTQLQTIDPPAIGVNTVEAVAKAGLAGILIEAGRSVIVDEPRVRARADELGIFVFASTAATP